MTRGSAGASPVLLDRIMSDCATRHRQGMMGEANLRYARGDTEDAETICKEIIRQCE